jgi:hypothetical protein
MVRASLMDARIEGVSLLPGPVSLYASTRSLYAGTRHGCGSTGTVAGTRIRGNGWLRSWPAAREQWVQ